MYKLRSSGMNDYAIETHMRFFQSVKQSGLLEKFTTSAPIKAAWEMVGQGFSYPMIAAQLRIPQPFLKKEIERIKSDVLLGIGLIPTNVESGQEMFEGSAVTDKDPNMGSSDLVSETNLSDDLKAILEREGIETIQDVLTHSRTSMQAIKGLGAQKVGQIAKMMQAKGLEW